METETIPVVIGAVGRLNNGLEKTHGRNPWDNQH